MQTTQQDFRETNIPTQSAVKSFPYDERLSSWEMSQLWVIYQANSSMRCILQYFVAKAQDPEIKDVLNDALNFIPPQLNSISNIFDSVGFPIPHGFNDEDVEPNAKRLFSDSFMLVYLRTINKFGLVKLAHSLPMASRPDVRAYLNSALVEAQNLLNKTEDILAKKGLAVKPPYTPVPDRVTYVTDSASYVGGLLEKRRSINVLELSHVFERLETKLAERALLLAFTQVAKDQKIKAHFSRGMDVLNKEVNRWSIILNNEDLILPISWRSEVTESTESPFSDRLMLFHKMNSISYSVTANGFALANCNRTDLVKAFSKSILEIQSYGKSGLELLIENRWMEEIPQVADRKQINSLSH